MTIDNNSVCKHIVSTHKTIKNKSKKNFIQWKKKNSDFLMELLYFLLTMR